MSSMGYGWAYRYAFISYSIHIILTTLCYADENEGKVRSRMQGMVLVIDSVSRKTGRCVEV